MYFRPITLADDTKVQLSNQNRTVNFKKCGKSLTRTDLAKKLYELALQLDPTIGNQHDEEETEGEDIEHDIFAF